MQGAWRPRKRAPRARLLGAALAAIGIAGSYKSNRGLVGTAPSPRSGSPVSRLLQGMRLLGT